MKLFKKLILIFLVLFVLYLLILHVVVGIKGRSLLVSKLEEAFNHQASVGSVRTVFPADVVVSDIEVKDLFTIKKVFARGGVIDIFRRGFVLSEMRINQAVVNLERTFDDVVKEALLIEENKAKNAPPAEPAPAPSDTGATSAPQQKLFLSSLAINKLIISDSEINFVDQRSKDRSIKITVKELNLNVKNLNFPIAKSEITTFELNGKLPWREADQEGQLTMSGWVNLPKKDMQADLEIKDIDGVYLYPYYATWFDLEKARIQQANLQFKSEITAHGNDLVADCHLELTDVVFRAKEEDESDARIHKIAAAVLDIFKTINKGGISLNFTIRTKLNRPEFGFENIRSAFEDKVAKSLRSGRMSAQDLVSLPADLVGGVVGGATDITRSLIETTAGLGRALIDSFKKDEE